MVVVDKYKIINGKNLHKYTYKFISMYYNFINMKYKTIALTPSQYNELRKLKQWEFLIAGKERNFGEIVADACASRLKVIKAQITWTPELKAKVREQFGVNPEEVK